MGIEMVVSTFIGLAIGLYLDGLFDTKPWLTIFFLVVGIAAGFKNIFLEIKKIDNYITNTNMLYFHRSTFFTIGTISLTFLLRNKSG